MVKHMSVKGFTLIETLLVLCVLSLFILIFPFLKPANSIVLRYQMQTMYQKLLQLQYEALSQKREISVVFQGNSYVLDSISGTWGYGISCSSTTIHFTPLATVSHADTLKCSLGESHHCIVIELGTGRMYVR